MFTCTHILKYWKKLYVICWLLLGLCSVTFKLEMKCLWKIVKQTIMFVALVFLYLSLVFTIKTLSSFSVLIKISLLYIFDHSWIYTIHCNNNFLLIYSFHKMDFIFNFKVFVDSVLEMTIIYFINYLYKWNTQSNSFQSNVQQVVSIDSHIYFVWIYLNLIKY